MTKRLWTVIPVWIAAVVAAVFIALLAPPDDYLSWMPIAMAALILITFVVQLAIVQKEGLVDRMVASLAGGILILGVATLALGLISIG